MAKKNRGAGMELRIPNERIERRIYVLRGVKVILSGDLAELYGVPAKQLNQSVKRNLERFPDDFMFQLTPAEYKNLKSQLVTSSWGGARRARPYAFTEEGVAMLSAVLRSPTAVAVSIEIVRVFVRLRQALASHDHLSRRLDELEQRMTEQDGKFSLVFEAIRELMDDDEKGRRKPPIGYHTEVRRTKKREGSRNRLATLVPTRANAARRSGAVNGG